MSERADKWILNGTIPEPCLDLMRWAHWLETADRRVASTELEYDIWVSTVFLGLDHSWGDGPPILFETMVFGPPEQTEIFGRTRTLRPESHLGDMARYSTWEEAMIGHGRIVGRVRVALEHSAVAAELVASAVLQKICRAGEVE